MTRNVGTIDRAVRLLLSAGLFTLLAVGEGSMRWVGLLGVVPLLTAAIGFCPLYRLFGLSTCRISERSA